MTRQVGGHVMDGHDVAGSYQPDFPWQISRSAGDELAAWKATQGTGFADHWFARNRDATEALGFRYRGIYHWQSPNDPVGAQLAFFRSVVGDLRPGEFIQLDQEQPGLSLDAVVAACAVWSQVYPGRVAHYGGASFGWTGGHAHPRLREWPWWLAAYRATMPVTAVRPVIWQWGGFPVAGVGSVDANQIIDRAALERLAGYTDTPGPLPDDEELYVERFVRRKDRNAVYLGNFVSKIWMKDPAVYQRKRAAMAFNGMPSAFLEEHVVDTQEDLDLWGVTVGEDPGDV
jgi:lysozyme